ncbi:MAG: hypothetical protein KUG77_17210 [Nannocystaceae bacterium]|nr:hypothetical protein [Nannocystaceae bacterium]
MGEFSPVQLDGLEDALEDLELTGIPLEFEDDAAVSGRLSEYRDLLRLSRDALPSVEVPPGVLNSVLAAARDEAALPVVAASPRADGSTESKTPWWKRLSLWVPALAVGASAALVLVMVQGTLSGAESEGTAVATADAMEKRAPSAGAVLQQGAELQAAVELPVEAAAEGEGVGLGALESRGRLRGSAAVDRAGEDKEAVIEEAKSEAEESEAPGSVPSAPSAPPEPTDTVIYDGAKEAPAKGRNAKRSKPSSSRTAGKKRDTSKPVPAPRPAPAPKAKAPAEGAGIVDPSAAALSSADGKRRKGRCTSARSMYRGLVDHDDANTRARALAGLGLCALSDGDDDAADAYFSRARNADGSIVSFIAAQRDAGPAAQQAH